MVVLTWLHTARPGRVWAWWLSQRFTCIGLNQPFYVSCDAASLARDCAIFREVGYEAEKVTAVDMFPRTIHVETVVLLSQR